MDQSCLQADDLDVIKININYGTKDKTNPVLSMLFYTKGSDQGYLLTEEELRTVVPQQIFQEQLIVISRRDDPKIVEQARAATKAWASQFPGWRVRLC